MITIRGTQLPEDEKYTSAIFLDNDPDKIKNVNDICPRITTISIPQTSHKVDPCPSILMK